MMTPSMPCPSSRNGRGEHRLLPTLFNEIVALASSRTPQFVSGLILCGAVSFALSDFRLAAWSFLGQRLMLIALLWPVVGTSLAITGAIAAVAIALIFTISAWCSWYVQRSARKSGTEATTGGTPLSRFALRFLAAAFAILVSYGLVQKYPVSSLPSLTALTVAWLFVSSLLSILLPDHALHTGVGILNFADGCRILYAFWQPVPLVWGLWMVCDVLIALAASYLYNAGGSAIKSKRTGGQR